MEDLFGGARDTVTGAVKSANIGERMEKLRLPEARERAAGGGDDEARRPRPADQDSRLARLEKLGDLKDKGVISDEEFAAEKARAMGGGESEKARPRT